MFWYYFSMLIWVCYFGNLSWQKVLHGVSHNSYIFQKFNLQSIEFWLCSQILKICLSACLSSELKKSEICLSGCVKKEKNWKPVCLSEPKKKENGSLSEQLCLNLKVWKPDWMLNQKILKICLSRSVCLNQKITNLFVSQKNCLFFLR